uniref:RNA binding motif protein 28 n=1 Tax=Sphenodon punctatus TaxID=8508 RepID=A0A8D0L193_SPHPU
MLWGFHPTPAPRVMGGSATLWLWGSLSPPDSARPLWGVSDLPRLLLSPQCSEDDLRALFSPFGAVLEVNIPRKPDGKMRGFAFVQFQNVLEAGKALRVMNMKEIKGECLRPCWPRTGTSRKELPEEEEEEELKEAGSAVEAGDSSAEEEEELCEAGSAVEAGDSSAEEEEELCEAGSAVEAGDSSAEEEEELCEAGSAVEAGDSSAEEEELSEAGSVARDSSEEEEGESTNSDEEGFIQFSPPPPPRNLSFDTEEEELGEVLERFGDLKYVRIVLHPDSERSKGCAFAQFLTQEAAQTCLKAAEDESEGGGLHLGGRRLHAHLAVSREEAQKLRGQKVKKPTGTRNLYLAREGLIRAGTKAAEGISDADLAKRARFEELKHQKLKDQNIFVSLTRLCVHNLPKSVDDAGLRQLMLSAVRGGKGVRIKECRVMRDLKPSEGKGRGQSLGYAFVEFQEHEQALAALRHVNNNPQLFGPQKVSFPPCPRRKTTFPLVQQKLRQRQAAQGPKPEARGPDAKDATATPAGTKQAVRGPAAAAAGSWLGFQTKAEVERVELPDGKKRRKVLMLPSHRGPKIRERNKGKGKPLPPPAKKPKTPAQSRQQERQRVGPSKAEDRFQQLVEQYKRKILGTGKSPSRAKRGKWFES